MRTVLFYLALVGQTVFWGPIVQLAVLLGARSRPGNWLDRLPRAFTRILLRSAGVRMTVHHPERILREQTAVYVANHVSWFDIFSLATILPHYRFIAKAELRRIPIFGPAAEHVAAIYIDRKNRKKAFGAYRMAAEKVQDGMSVVVCPEGTRGYDYRLRPFKKGPFVLAIAAGVPIVPVVVHGTREIQPKGSFAVRGGRIEITVLEAIPTAGLDYDQRETLMKRVWQAMEAEMEARYGIRSTASAVAPAEAEGVEA